MPEQAWVSFEHFLERFPVVRLPITLTDELSHVFSQTNEPLPQIIIDQYILPIEAEDYDADLTEFVPCFKIPDTYGFHAVVYWKAGLMNYQYILATFSKQGQLIDKNVLAGTYAEGETLTQSVATIDEDWNILILTGQQSGKQIYDASSSKTTQLEITPEGQIIASS